MVGKTISHYKVIERLGEGGMGVVYKAEDTKLKRTVALKFLSAQALGTEDEKARFVREAQAAASLNHPNICTIYEIQEVDDQLFISMEYIDGETLHDKIKGVGATGGSPLKIKEALKIATMTAEGLQAAHEQGIIHRDIKTSNIMLTKKGVAKIMDFGLAKVSAGSMLTKAGTTLGTICYMSPEQARGEPVDQRSDIWAMGIVLYEMITGQLPFKGEYEQAMVYSILNVDPEPLTALRTGVPIALDTIVAKLLAKDPADRYQHVDELPVDLKAVEVKRGSTATLSTMTATQLVAQPDKKRSRLWIAVTVATILTAIVVGCVVWYLKPLPSESVRRLTVNLPPEHQQDSGIALSPDGKNLVYSANKDGDRHLFLRSLENYEVTLLLGTEGGYRPFFSLDGKWIGFHTDSEIKKVAMTGGNAQSIFKRTDILSTGIWGPDNTIIIGRHKSGIYRVSATGGEPEVLAVPDEESGEIWEFPALLQGTKTIFFTIHGARYEEGIFHSIGAMNMETGTRKFLVENSSDPRYVSSGHLLFVQDEQVMAVTFDAQQVEITGTPVPVAEGIRIVGSARLFGAYSMTDDGTLAYTPAFEIDEQPMPLLVWVDRTGNVTPITNERRYYRRPRLSPDSKRIAIMIGEEFGGGALTDIHIYDIDRDRFNRFTFEGNNRVPTWTPDGTKVIFNSTRDAGIHNLYWKPADGGGKAERLLESKKFRHFPDGISPDGRLLAFFENNSETGQDIWIFDLNERAASQFLVTPANERGPMFSPDGQWITYTSDESGQNEVYVRPYPKVSGVKYQISIEGGDEPTWSPKGRELFYRSGNRFMVVTIDTAPVFRPGTPQLLFDGHYQKNLQGNAPEYDVHPDGNRFLMLQTASKEEIEELERELPLNRINIVLNFFEELKRLVPTDN